MLKKQAYSLTDYLTAMLLLVLLLIGLALNGSSQGYSRGGEDDEGSGIGGTGRYPGSIIGNGALKPFLGQSELPDEIYLLELPGPSLAPPLPFAPAVPSSASAPARRPLPSPLNFPAATEVSRPGAVDIATALMRQLDTEAYYFQLPEDLAPAEPATAKAETATLSWTDLKEILTAMGAAIDTDTGAAFTPAADPGMSRPEQSAPRFQRPDLPPIQRVRPVERVTVVPPRIQPMRI